MRSPADYLCLPDITLRSGHRVIVLQQLFFCTVDLIADMYKNAYEKKPDSEDILNALFMAYVRIGNYKKQQQIAMALHKLRPLKNPYYFWAVMSIVMQVGAVLYVTHLHKTSCKLENSVSRY